MFFKKVSFRSESESRGYIFKHMRQKHHNWFVRIFSYPTVVEDLLRSFVHEDFVKELDFKSLKKLDPIFSLPQKARVMPM